VKGEAGRLDDVGVPEQVPGIHDHVVAERDVHAGGEELLDLREAAPRRVGIEPPLDERVRERVHHHVDAGPPQEAVELRGVVGLVGPHRGAVARRHPAREAVLDGVVRHELEEARVGIVRLVAVDVDPAPVALGQVEDAVHLAGAELGGRLVVRDASDAVGAETERVLEPLLVARACIDPVLREGGHLDRDEVCELVAEGEKAAEGRLVLARDIGVGADVERPVRDRPLHDLPGAREDVLDRELGLQLAPDVDPLDKGPRLVEARPPGGQTRVEMKVAVDERGRREPPLGVDRARRVHPDLFPDPGEAAALDREVDGALAAGQADVRDDEIGAHAQIVERALGGVRRTREDCGRRRKEA
jgi:hypothetical protein